VEKGRRWEEEGAGRTGGISRSRLVVRPVCDACVVMKKRPGGLDVDIKYGGHDV